MSIRYELKVNASKEEMDRIAAWLTLPDNIPLDDPDCTNWERCKNHFEREGYDLGRRFEEVIQLIPGAGYVLLETDYDQEASRRRFFHDGRLVHTEVIEVVTAAEAGAKHRRCTSRRARTGRYKSR